MLLYLSAYLEQQRDRYYELLLTVSQTGDWTTWLRFFLDAVTAQASDAAARARQIVALAEDLRRELRESGATPTVVRAAEQVISHPATTARRLAAALGSTWPTAQKAIADLEARGVLREITGRKRDRVYVADSLREAVYGPLPGPRGPQQRLALDAP